MRQSQTLKSCAVNSRRRPPDRMSKPILHLLTPPVPRCLAWLSFVPNLSVLRSKKPALCYQTGFLWSEKQPPFFKKSARFTVFWAQETISKLLCLQGLVLQAHRRPRAISYFHLHLLHCPLAFGIEWQDSGWNPPVHHGTACTEYDNRLLWADIMFLGWDRSFTICQKCQ